jgi:CHAT domain-containing protein/tetratricopeptide (TPR) repeat protein
MAVSRDPYNFYCLGQWLLVAPVCRALRAVRAGLQMLCIVTAAVLPPAPVLPAQQTPPPAPPNPLLTTEPTVSGELSFAQSFSARLEYQQLASYRATIPAGNTVTVRLVQQEGAVSATWLSPDGTAHDARRNDTGRGSLIRFTLVAAQDGKYDFRVLCTTKAVPCEVRFTADAPHPASDSDRTRFAAEELLAQGNAIQRSTDKSARAGAFAVYDQVVQQAQSIGDLPLQRFALYWRARLSMELQKYADSLASAQRAVAIGGASADPHGVAASWKVLGYANAYLGNLDAAIDAYQHAAEIYAATGDRLNNEILQENMARAHRAMGQNGKAIEELTVALAEARAIQDSHGIPASLEELGNLRLARGELQPALDSYHEALDALAQWPDDTIHAHVLNGIGHVDTLLGETDDASDALAQSVVLWRKLKDTTGEAYALDGQGFLAYTTHDYAAAIRRFRETLDLVQGLKLERETAIILEELGEAEQAAGSLDAANGEFQQSLALAKKLHLAGTQADCLRSLGEAAAARGGYGTALSDYSQAGELYSSLGGGPNQALLQGDEANLERAQNHLAAAGQHMEQALAVIESSRKSIRNTGYRSAFFSTQRNYYDLDIELLMQMEQASPGLGYAARALEVSERARARALIDSLHEQGVHIPSAGADLAAKDAALSDAIEARSFLVQQASETEAGASAADRAKLDSLKAEQEQLRQQIRANDPAYASLAQGEIVSVDTLQQQLLDSKTVLLEYWLGTSHSYLWAVTKHQLFSFVLAPGSALDAQSRELYANLIARNLNATGETLAARTERIARTDALAARQAAALARAVLAPAADLLRTHPNVVVVNEGALASIPFAALPLGGHPLIESHDVAYLPSASVLPELRSNRPPARPERIALIADPVFSAHDPRVQGVGEASSKEARTALANSEDLTRSAGDAGLREFPRLIYSRQEAEAIGRLLPASQQWTAIDFDANLDAIRSLDWSQFTIAHFSTHALLDTIHPDLSGIVLSLVNKDGRPRDGFVRVRDIYNMHIPANLVVLSACRTALGKEIRGEGVVGLARAFEYAGSQRVLATLWDVNDHATADLMADVYRGLLESRLPPAAALAQAQRRLARSVTWRAPYFWATFVLQGDWQPSPELEARR